MLIPHIPYKGGKQKLAAKIIHDLPAAHTFVDLFAGGGAVTAAAMLSRKYQRFIMNDRAKGLTQLFCDAVNGKYRNDTRWVSREEFYAEKDNSPYIRFCWSFGNNGREYMYNPQIEPWKRAFHKACMHGDFTEIETYGITFNDYIKQMPNGKEKRLEMRNYIGVWVIAQYPWFKNHHHDFYISKTNYQHFITKGESPRDYTPLSGNEPLQKVDTLQNLEGLQSMERLQNLECLQTLPQMQALTAYELDYTAVQIPTGSVVYADPPYKGTDGYDCKNGKNDFDSEAFFDYVRSSPHFIVVSEYAAPPDFVCVKEYAHSSILSQTHNRRNVERLFVHESKLHLMPKTQLFEIWEQ